MISDEELKNLIGKPFNGNCWAFCRMCDPSLPAKPYLGMSRIRVSQVGCVVLFKIGKEWHSGIVWPDGLHFVHAKPEKDGTYTVKKERLTQLPWRLLVEGYYVPCQK